MQTILTPFLLFLAALMALITYALIPSASRIALATGAAVMLAVGIWWHWMQFSVEYRTSTWQEHLRQYASYIMVFVVILASYGFYAFAWQGAPERATTNLSAVTTAVSNISSRLSSNSESEGPNANLRRRSSSNRGANRGANRGLSSDSLNEMEGAQPRQRTSNFLL